MLILKLKIEKMLVLQIEKKVPDSRQGRGLFITWFVFICKWSSFVGQENLRLNSMKEDVGSESREWNDTGKCNTGKMKLIQVDSRLRVL